MSIVKRYIYIIIFIVYVLVSCAYMSTQEFELSYAGHTTRYLIFASVFTIFVFLTIWPYRLRLNKRLLSFEFFFIYTLLVSFVSMFLGGYSLIDIISKVLNLLYFSVLLYMAFSYAAFRTPNKIDKIIYVLSLILLSYIYWTIFTELNILQTSHLSSSYNLLYILPFVLLINSKIIKTISFIVVAIAVFSSMKRGGFVALIIGLVIYILTTSYIKTGKISKTFLFSAFVLAVSSYLFFEISGISDSPEASVVNRLESIQDDGGSGRKDIYAEVVSMIFNQDLHTFIFGNGYNKVIVDSKLGYSAHNDFLEIWYDFGLIGLLLYIIPILSMVKITIKAVKKRIPIAPNMCMELTIFLILSNISHIVIYFNLGFFMLFFGLYMGELKRIKFIR